MGINYYVTYKTMKFGLEFIRCFPHLILFFGHKKRETIKIDVEKWLQTLHIKYVKPIGFIYLLGFYPEFRNVFYYRIGIFKYLLNIFCPQVSTLIIITKEIGEGLYINHGFATAIGAKSIGKNCIISQQVTIGNHDGYPTILDNVIINSGAVIVGNITIGNNVTIGANATVFSDIPDNCTVYPPLSRVMRWQDSKNQSFTNNGQ